MAMRVGMLGTTDHIHLFAPAAARRDDVEFVGIYGPDEAKGKETAEKFGTKLYTEADALLDQKLDAVGVFTPFRRKADDIATCLERGLHVFSDKPLATNPEGLKRVQAAVKAHPDLRLTMGLTCRVAPRYVRLRQLVQQGAIGKLVSLMVRRSYRMKRDKRPDFMFDSSLSGGIWVELSVHDIDYISWLTGTDYLAVSATHGNASCPDEPFQDHAEGLFQLDGAVTALIEQHRLVPEVGEASSDHRFSALGTEGVVDIGPGDAFTLWTAGSGKTAVSDVPGWGDLFGNFLDATRGDAELIVPTEAVLRTTEVALAAYASSEAGGKLIQV